MKNFGYINNINSPTYTYIKEYFIKKYIIYHIDLFRLYNLNELINLNFFDLLDKKKNKFVFFFNRMAK
ncbi:tRNA (adenosine(37)-N6)-threonylcarbamoyltransferase complex ATPase subunit type 1 TsaE [endosymbiont of Sipalinus gigas]|uniref:tRNA (adenosine(37)-N6)-threonylcarbamoyltransferase complex ATPase subunit type 1 TsaE n=1 Tax=endosymbiont of Sipalinus gigas TaxID=1972134 RepID=UPI003B9776BD